mmetsp:Transcript_2787/g.5132  ORF Transcript_2787/g.5132 Transcript_2787/m.5132 type:complete len:161 (-) Transcript_2787:198-680(-)
MPRVALELKADLQGISYFEPLDPTTFAWRFRLRCTSCGEETPNPVVFSSTDSVERRRGTPVNLEIRCKLCGRENDITVLTNQTTPRYSSTANGDWTRFSSFDCHGLEPISWFCLGEMHVVGDGGFVFDDASLDEGEFFGYEENINSEASITNLEYRFSKE